MVLEKTTWLLQIPGHSYSIWTNSERTKDDILAVFGKISPVALSVGDQGYEDSK